MKLFVVGGAASGTGKTTVTLGLMAALRRRGLVVQGFKVGPDFIDPAFHALVTGRPSYTLDGWMCGAAAVRATVARYARDADVAVVEGMMGCFDGIDGVSEEGSTAQVAKWLSAPLVLVVDASASSRSAAAVALGFERFDLGLDVAAVVVNNTGSAAHGRWVLDAIGGACRAPALGALTRDPQLTLPERHLGLVTAAEGPLTADRLRALGEAVERAIDLDRLLRLARSLEPAAPEAYRPAAGTARIAVACDRAFQFYYAENLARLRAAGAALVFWSPERDAELPEADALYFGGGYPELRAGALAANAGIRRAVKKFADAGGVVYAECGGLMYLAEAIEDEAGACHEMVGILPATVRMRPRRLSIGYRSLTTTQASALGPAGTIARGHEFHYSTLDPVPPSIPRVYRLADAMGHVRAEGYQVGRALLSYAHLHFASNPELAPALVAACAGRAA